MEDHPREICHVEDRRLRTEKAGPGEICLAEVGIRQRGAGEPRRPEICLREVSASQRCIREVGSRQLGLAQINSWARRNALSAWNGLP